MRQLDNCADIPKLDLEYLEQRVGFLVYLDIAHHLISSFFKLLYLIMNYLRKGRDNTGLKIPKQAYNSFLKYSPRSGQHYAQGRFSGDNYSDPFYVTAMHQLPKHLFS